MKPGELRALTYAILISELVSGDVTLTDLIDATGLGRGAVLMTIRALRKKKVIYICAWEKDSCGRHSRAVFRMGDKPDVPRPKKTQAQISQMWRDRQSARRLAMRLTQRVEA